MEEVRAQQAALGGAYDASLEFESVSLESFRVSARGGGQRRRFLWPTLVVGSGWWPVASG
jgi:hypothetical protein